MEVNLLTVLVEDGHAAEDGGETAPPESGRREQDDEIARRYPHFEKRVLLLSHRNKREKGARLIDWFVCPRHNSIRPCSINHHRRSTITVAAAGVKGHRQVIITALSTLINTRRMFERKKRAKKKMIFSCLSLSISLLQLLSSSLARGNDATQTPGKLVRRALGLIG